MKRLAPPRAALGLLLALLAAAPPLAAQSVRVRSTTTARYVQLRPLLYNADSARYDVQSAEAATPVTQDLEVNAWGFGMDGLRFYGLVRLRGSLGSDLVWPRYGDHFDALAVYLEYEHANYRLRLGRQQKASALGWYGYDGLSAAWHPVAPLRVEGYAGRGLARGYLEPYNSAALTALDPLRPDKGTYLFGVSASVKPTATSSFAAIYQKEILTDRSGIVSERAALDGSIGLGFLTLAGATDFDLGTNEWGKARGTATLHLGRAASVTGEVFQYRPTIDLTTIWGVFGPQSHWGYGGTLQLVPWRRAGLWGSWYERRYEPVTGTTSPFATDLPDREQEVAAGLRSQMGPVQLDGSYRLTVDYGGRHSGGDAALTVAPAPDWRVGVRGAAFQREGEFRVSGATVYGVGQTGSARLADRFDVRADVMRYMQQQLRGVTPSGVDWNQTRATLTVDWTFGTNPDRQGGTR